MTKRPADDYAGTMEGLDMLYDLLDPTQRAALVAELKRVTFVHAALALPDEDQTILRAAGRAMVEQGKQ